MVGDADAKAPSAPSLEQVPQELEWVQSRDRGSSASWSVPWGRGRFCYGQSCGKFSGTPEQGSPETIDYNSDSFGSMTTCGTGLVVFDGHRSVVNAANVRIELPISIVFCAFSHNGNIMCSQHGRALYVWDVVETATVKKFFHTALNGHRVSVSHDGGYVAVSHSKNGVATIHFLKIPKKPTELEAKCVFFGSSTVAAVLRKDRVDIIDVPSLHVHRTFEAPEAATHVECSHEAKLVCVFTPLDVSVWSLGVKVAVLPLEYFMLSPSTRCQFPDDETLVLYDGKTAQYFRLVAAKS